jgi:hypothetical protein
VNEQEFYRQALRHKFIYSMTGLFLGLVCVIGGIVLFLSGVAGSTNWTAKIIGSQSTMTDAAPGAILFVVGLFVVLVTRYNVKVKHIPTKYGERKLVVFHKQP